jgi:hypothetical protein
MFERKSLTRKIIGSKSIQGLLTFHVGISPQAARESNKKKRSKAGLNVILLPLKSVRLPIVPVEVPKKFFPLDLNSPEVQCWVDTECHLRTVHHSILHATQADDEELLKAFHCR